jgi:hypothetical protein
MNMSILVLDGVKYNLLIPNEENLDEILKILEDAYNQQMS